MTEATYLTALSGAKHLFATLIILVFSSLGPVGSKDIVHENSTCKQIRSRALYIPQFVKFLVMVFDVLFYCDTTDNELYSIALQKATL